MRLVMFAAAVLGAGVLLGCLLYQPNPALGGAVGGFVAFAVLLVIAKRTKGKDTRLNRLGKG